MSSEKEKFDKSTEKAKHYYWKNPEAARAAQKRYRAAHKDALRIKKRIYAQNESPEAKENRKGYRRVWEKENRIRKEAYRIRRKFDMVSNDEAEKLVIHREAGVCECCGATGVHRRLMHIDHSHVTGKIRAVICNKCNTSLGLVNDSIEHLEKLIDYLLVHAA